MSLLVLPPAPGDRIQGGPRLCRPGRAQAARGGEERAGDSSRWLGPCPAHAHALPTPTPTLLPPRLPRPGLAPARAPASARGRRPGDAEPGRAPGHAPAPAPHLRAPPPACAPPPRPPTWAGRSRDVTRRASLPSRDVRGTRHGRSGDWGLVRVGGKGELGGEREEGGVGFGELGGGALGACRGGRQEHLDTPPWRRGPGLRPRACRGQSWRLLVEGVARPLRVRPVAFGARKEADPLVRPIQTGVAFVCAGGGRREAWPSTPGLWSI